MRVLELGGYIVPGYAGMLLAEQGHDVVKWHNGRDPILGLRQGDELWDWINHGKVLQERHVTDILDLSPNSYPDVVIDNFKPETLDAWGINSQALAEKMQCAWVSMRNEYGPVSFDLIAQCRSWLEYGEYLPFYIGDTAGGLWLAFKSVSLYAQGKIGHYVLGQASCLQKLVEGELQVVPMHGRDGEVAPWDEPNTYYFDHFREEGVTVFKGKTYREPVRNHPWKLTHLWHDNGRIRI